MKKSGAFRAAAFMMEKTFQKNLFCGTLLKEIELTE